MFNFFDSELNNTDSLVFLFFLLKSNLQVPVFESKIIHPYISHLIQLYYCFTNFVEANGCLDVRHCVLSS